MAHPGRVEDATFGLIFTSKTCEQYTLLNDYLGINPASSHSKLKHIFRDFRAVCIDQKQPAYKVQASFTGAWYFCHSLLKLLSNPNVVPPPNFAPPWLDGNSIKPVWLSLSTETENTLIPNDGGKKREILNVTNIPGYMFSLKKDYQMSNLDKSSQYIAINIDAYNLIYGGADPSQVNVCDSEILLQVPKCCISLVYSLFNSVLIFLVFLFPFFR